MAPNKQTLQTLQKSVENSESTQKQFNPLRPSQFNSMQILLTLSTQNKLFGNENNVNDQTQQFI